MNPQIIIIVSLISLGISCAEEQQFKGATTSTTAPRTPKVATPPAATTDELSSTAAKPVVPAPVAPIPPASAIKKGSFTVFTVPTDPTPLNPYDIIITVDLSSADLTNNYKKDDLTGSITGSDGFMYGLNSPSVDIETFIFDFATNKAILKITIPGAVNNTKDTIFIRSELLDESQTVELVF